MRLGPTEGFRLPLTPQIQGNLNQTPTLEPKVPSTSGAPQQSRTGAIVNLPPLHGVQNENITPSDGPPPAVVSRTLDPLVREV